MKTSTALKEHSVLFNGPMVRAILDGSKTMTRRVVKGNFAPDQFIREKSGTGYGWHWPNWKGKETLWTMTGAVGVAKDAGFDVRVKCPYGVPGDHLYVRETTSPIPDAKPAGYFTDPKWINRKYWYAADNDKPTWGGKWTPSILMPRDASRITLEITDIRVERLQEITEADAIAEGFKAGDGRPENGFNTESPFTAVSAFRSLWEQLNAEREKCKTCKGHGVVPAWSGSVSGGSLMQDSKDCPDCKGNDTGYGWDQNPWVWCISFRRID